MGIGNGGLLFWVQTISLGSKFEIIFGGLWNLHEQMALV